MKVREMKRKYCRPPSLSPAMPSSSFPLRIHPLYLRNAKILRPIGFRLRYRSQSRERARVCSRWACSHLRGAPRCDQNNPFFQRYSASNSDLERVTSLGSRPKIASHAPCPIRDSRSLEGGDLIRRGVSVTTFWQHVEWPRRVKRRGGDRSAVSNCSSYFKVS